jgi:hypothetical protein
MHNFLQKGAALNIRRNNGWTALDILGRRSKEAKELQMLAQKTQSFSKGLQREHDTWKKSRG